MRRLPPLIKTPHVVAGRPAQTTSAMNRCALSQRHSPAHLGPLAGTTPSSWS